jgi:hypothetical protein
MLVTKKPPALGRGFSWDALTTINAPWRLMPELSLRKPGTQVPDDFTGTSDAAEERFLPAVGETRLL